jgi:hypothetical protein
MAPYNVALLALACAAVPSTAFVLRPSIKTLPKQLAAKENGNDIDSFGNFAASVVLSLAILASPGPAFADGE